MQAEPGKKTARHFDLDSAIGELVGTLTDPIIAWPGGWMDSIPEKVKDQIPLQRMIVEMQYQRGLIPERTATDAEAVAYMFPRTMEAPLDRDWTDIYLYLGNQMAKSYGTEVPDDIKMDSLPEDLQRKLDHLKRWIYEKRVAARKARERQDRKEMKEAEKPESPEFVQHTFDLD